jgi:peptidoglycan/xylan/chitin deacetylase (PgdA/CDA1 family)
MGRKLDHLLARAVPAVWFCTGTLLEARPQAAIRAIRAGHILGNHAYEHPYFSDCGLEECYRQIEKADEVIEHVYREAGVVRPAKYFRFPHGDKGGLKHAEVLEPYSGAGARRKEAIQNCLRSLGYSRPDWSEVVYAWYRAAVWNRRHRGGLCADG